MFKRLRAEVLPYVAFVICTGAAALFLMSCDSPTGASLWNDELPPPSDPAPQIERVDPEERWLAGVGQLTIHGSNFSGTLADNLIYFNNQRVPAVEGSTTHLVVDTPNIVDNNVRVRVIVPTAYEPSNEYIYRLEQAVFPLGTAAGVLPTDEPRTLLVDDELNLYSYFTEFGGHGGIIRYSHPGDRERIIPPAAWGYVNKVFGFDGDLFMVRGGVVPIIYRAARGGGSESVWVGPAGMGRMGALAFDGQYLWGGGNNAGTANAAIFRLDADRNQERFPFNGNVRGLEFYGEFLYFAADKDGQQGVWRMPVAADRTLGEAELAFDVGTVSATARPMALAFAADGRMFVGLDAAPGLILVSADRTTAEAFYDDLIHAPIVALAWARGTVLYAVRYGVEEPPRHILHIETMISGPNY